MSQDKEDKERKIKISRNFEDMHIHPKDFGNPLDFIEQILREGCDRSTAALIIETYIPTYENERDAAMQRMRKYREDYPDRISETSVGTTAKICTDNILLLKDALSVVKKRGISALKNWYGKRYEEHENSQALLRSKYPSMFKENIKPEKYKLGENQIKSCPLLINKQEFHSILGNLPFMIDKKSAESSDSIYENWEEGNTKPDLDHRINIIGPYREEWGAYLYFYNQMIEGQKLENIGHIPFFYNYCLLGGNPKQKKRIGDGCRHHKNFDNDTALQDKIKKAIPI